MRNIIVSLAVVAAAAGCGSESPSDASGPVKLERILVQDAVPHGARGVAMDLLDTAGSPLTSALACDDNHPCVSLYVIGGIVPDASCTAAGLCTDPLAAGAAPLIPPETHQPGEAGGTQIRLVFSKLLPANVDTTKVFELDDATGTPVAGTVAWDPSGSATLTSDPVNAPFGPAIVFKPNAPLDASASYTIKVDASLVTDRAGNPMADQNGTVIAGTYTKAFTTEGLLLLPKTTKSNIANGALTLTPDEIVQLSFNAPSTATCTVTTGGAAVSVIAYADLGADATNCSAADATLVNIVAVDGSGTTMNWAAGDYAVSCAVSPAGGGAAVTVTGTFSVGGTVVANDPLSRDQHAICN